MGYESYLEKEACHDCGAEPGELHDPGCDTEQCPLCGFQVISCEHGEDVLRKTSRWFKERLPWTGIWSMTMEAIEYGWFVRWEGPMPGGAWVDCPKDHPDAMPSRNHVAGRCRWDAKAKRFIKKDEDKHGS